MSTRIFSVIFEKRAFTLAEVLITLGIIGVVAAMTIPTIGGYLEQKQLVKAWRSTYSLLMQAQQQMATDNGGDITYAIPFDSGATSTVNFNAFMNSFKPYLKHIKTCNYMAYPACYSGVVKALTDDYTLTNYAANSSTMILTNGVVLFFYAGAPSICNDNKVCQDSYIFIDVNGAKLPNRMGKDIFALKFSPTKKLFLQPVESIKRCNETGLNCGEYYLIYD